MEPDMEAEAVDKLASGVQLPSVRSTVVTIAVCLVITVGSVIAIMAAQAKGLPRKSIGDKELLYEWAYVEYNWTSSDEEEAAKLDGTYVIENNVICGMKYYAGAIYVTVPRWRSGVPSSLNVVTKRSGRYVLQPYPSWQMNELGNCHSLQYIQSMEVDPISGRMWIIDIGRTNIFSNAINICPPKLVIWDLDQNREIHRYNFSDDVVSHTENFLNDIVVDPRSGFAYISDARGRGAIVVYDLKNDRAHRLEHPTMNYDPDAVNVTINGVTTSNIRTPIDGIALSSDKSQLFYSALSGYNLYQLPTHIAKQRKANFTDKVRIVGRKASQSDGLAFGRNHLYYGLFRMNSVYRWDMAADMALQKVPIESVNMMTQTEVTRDDEGMQWADTFAFDDEGHLLVVSNKLQNFIRRDMDFSGKSGSNMRIWKIFVNESSYIID